MPFVQFFFFFVLMRGSHTGTANVLTASRRDQVGFSSSARSFAMFHGEITQEEEKLSATIKNAGQTDVRACVFQCLGAALIYELADIPKSFWIRSPTFIWSLSPAAWTIAANAVKLSARENTPLHCQCVQAFVASQDPIAPPKK